jgi:GNAT superfamily N-acetyltransferase
MWLAQTGGQVLGAIVLDDEPPSYFSPADEPEIYVSGFITSRAAHARTVGRALLEHAKATARQAGISLLRLDCYAGGDGSLVTYYESVGFRRVTRFTVELMDAPYTACLLQQRVSPGPPEAIHNY